MDKNVMKMLSDLGFGNLWNNINVTSIQLNNIIQRIYVQQLQQWCSEHSSFPKLCSYNLFKFNFNQEKYLNVVNNINHRKTLSKFRCSSHKLLIEVGRYRNIDRNLRICTKCNMNQIENEYNFLLVCAFNSELRGQCFPRYYCHWPTINKFISIMQLSQKKIIVNLAKFIYCAMYKRTSNSLFYECMYLFLY
jgi:hypothetical protein